VGVKTFNGLGSFEIFLRKQALEQPERLYAAADTSAKVTEKVIKGVFGNKSELAPLATSTVDAREKPGDSNPDRPLLIDGTLLRDSIESFAELLGPDEAVAGVGSGEKILLYHELGSAHYPPRPAFSIGALKALPLIKKIVQRFLHPGESYGVTGKSSIEETL